MSSLIKLTRTIHFLEQFIIYNACMYLCMYTNIIWLRMIKARIRWCTCRVENILTLGKLLSLWFCFLPHSILFLIYQTSYLIYKIISNYELARPVMGTIFLVGWTKRAPHWGVQSRFRVICCRYVVCRMSVVCQINCVGGITCGPRACSKSFLGG